MTFLIDSHEDLAYAALTFGRDYRHSAYEIRRMEQDGPVPEVNGHALLGYPEFQRGQVGLVFGTLFVMPRKHKSAGYENQDFASLEEAYRKTRTQFDLYQRWAEESPDKYRLVRTRRDLAETVAAWQQPSQKPAPVGIVLLMEGAEGVSGPAELEEWWHLGLRFIGPVWAGSRYCGGNNNPGKFDHEGFRLLEIMADLGYTLDIAHMSEASSLQALDAYQGTIICSHANARALLRQDSTQRHLTDDQLRRLIERDGVIGVMPFNRFLLPGWKNTDSRALVTLNMFVDHIDHICQLAGNAAHVAIGSDYDGGFGWPAVPLEVDTIADLQKVEPLLAQRGYTQEQIAGIFHGNWLKILEKTLPA